MRTQPHPLCQPPSVKLTAHCSTSSSINLASFRWSTWSGVAAAQSSFRLCRANKGLGSIQYPISRMHSAGRRRAIGNEFTAVLSVFSNIILALMLATHCGYTDAVSGLFVFGDSYTDTGENVNYPYGMTWPGGASGGHRSSDGKNEVDYIADKLAVPSPTPWEYLGSGNANNGGVNFGVGGAGVTSAYGFKTLSQQVDSFESLVKSGAWSPEHLAQAAALVSIGVNDYTNYNNQHGNDPSGVEAFAQSVVDQMGASMERIAGLGVRNILVENLVPMECMPFTTLYVNGETACASSYLLETETSTHDAKLQAKVNELNKGGANIAMLDLTKALRTLFENGPAYGFTNAYSRCCSANCGTDGGSFSVCRDPSTHVIFDSIHPTDAAWKAVANLYSYNVGYTKGATLRAWIQNNKL